MLVAAPCRPSENERVCPPCTRSNYPPVALLGCQGSQKNVGSHSPHSRQTNGASSLSQTPHPPRLQQLVKDGEAFLSGECLHLGQLPNTSSTAPRLAHPRSRSSLQRNQRHLSCTQPQDCLQGRPSTILVSWSSDSWKVMDFNKHSRDFLKKYIFFILDVKAYISLQDQPAKITLGKPSQMCDSGILFLLHLKGHYSECTGPLREQSLRGKDNLSCLFPLCMKGLPVLRGQGTDARASYSSTVWKYWHLTIGPNHPLWQFSNCPTPDR